MKLIGCDPGFASFGLAVMQLDPVPRFTGVRVVRTTPEHAAKGIRKTEDNADRARELVRELRGEMADSEVVVIAVESVAFPVGKVQWSVISNLGRVRGLIDAVAEIEGIPVLEWHPMTLKKLVAGQKSATKEDMRERLEKQYPELARMWPPQKTLIEHAGDAAATCHVALQSDVVRAVLRAKGIAA